MTTLNYTWLSEPDPVWLPLKLAADEQFDAFYALPIEKQHETWLGYPHPVPEGTPMDLEVSFKQVPVRDGEKVEIKIYRNSEKLKTMSGKKAPMVLVAHGGGWVLGNHDVEEGACRWMAKETGAVIVDVNYRL
jgi:acetyl esterase